MPDPNDPTIMLQVQDDTLRKIADLIRPWSYARPEPVFPKITFVNEAGQSVWIQVDGNMNTNELNITFLPRTPRLPENTLVIPPGDRRTLGE